MLSTILDKFDDFCIIEHGLPNAIGMWKEEQATLVQLATTANPNYDWVEIGAFCGGSAVLLCLTRREMCNTPHVISVDINYSPMFDLNVYQRGKFQDIHRKIVCDSSIVSKYLHNKISFALIDGYHSFTQIITDFEELSARLTDDAILAFHDVSPNLKEVVKTRIDYENFATKVEDFYVDEAIGYICQKYNYTLIDLEIPLYQPHYKETGLKEWKRGATSPFHAIGAIKKL